MDNISDELNEKSAFINAKETRLAANHACAIAASVRTGMKNGFSFKLIGVKKIADEWFEFLPRKTLFGKKTKVIKRPEKWFRYSYNKLRLCNIKVILPETPSEADDDIGSSGIALACLYEDGHASLFVPEWSYDKETDKWSVVYKEKPCDDPSCAKSRFSDNSDELAAAITAMSDFTASLGLNEQTGMLLCGIEELNGRNANWDEYTGSGKTLIPTLRRPKLSEKSAHIYNAAELTPVFGGTYFREVKSAAEENERGDEFIRLAAELDRCQRNAMLYTVNES